MQARAGQSFVMAFGKTRKQDGAGHIGLKAEVEGSCPLAVCTAIQCTVVDTVESSENEMATAPDGAGPEATPDFGSNLRSPS